MSNVAVIGGRTESLGDFFRKLALRADLGEYDGAAVALTTPEGHSHTAWQVQPGFPATNALVTATSILHTVIVEGARLK